MDDMDTDVSGDRRGAAAGGAPEVFSPPPMPPTAVANGDLSAQDNAWGLVSLARQLIDQGKPSLALQAVTEQENRCLFRSRVLLRASIVLSIPVAGFPSFACVRDGFLWLRYLFAVLETLQRARELYRNRLQANSPVDELASLFAECAIAEAQPMVANNLPPPPPPSHAASPTPILLDSDETSILSMTGRKQIMLDAFADGSSFVCLQCGGLVSSLRRDEHMAYWCG
ncbi:hypothetical protein B296_00021708 [Ensete ventricosum]|uniref:C2HC zinc finger plants domain-containing protein n=1 Tax=Ensete ventricosum TaxID=4639 RepID=A0A426ZGQ7_ENSVE|nr:hypothetical protein B296_00021708 [Ensete ventricosum]